MNENEKNLSSIQAQKAKIRRRYQGIDNNQLEKIPAIPTVNFYEDQSTCRVAVYARVSTDDPRQTSSYELQKNHYEKVVRQRPGWNLVKIYADEGISGTSLQHRTAFLQMMQDCHDKKIDLIITKSVSRFARNVVDCIGYVRKLAALDPPVGIIFETEGIYSLQSNSEMALSFIATLAQEESHNKSEIMNASIEMRFGSGVFLTPKLLGYDHDEDGNLIINEEEAKTIRLIFFMYLYGYTCQEIASTLTKLKRHTKLGNTTWSPGSVLGILQNERHCGDVLARKTWTPNYLDHKSKKNRQDRNQYRQIGHHESIISRDDFLAVQKLITNAKYGYKGILPELQVISNGVLKGFVTINPRWSGFKAEDYKNASESVYTESEPPCDQCSALQKGEFDLRGFEVARAQFFNNADRLSITFSYEGMSLTTACVRKFTSHYVEMLVHPGHKLFVLRPADEKNKHAIRWSRLHDGIKVPRMISGAAFLPNLYQLFGWDPTCKYRIIGIKQQNQKESVLIFNLEDTEILYPADDITDNREKKQEPRIPSFEDDIEPLGTKKNILLYPKDWSASFGCDYYRQEQSNELIAFRTTGQWNSQARGKPYNPSPLQVTKPIGIVQNIDELIDGMQKEIKNEYRQSEEK
ncbi:MAG: recombinase family protein [Eubacteriales bacterium]|nr:recombinase family protein [Eubacteriales bacterium]